MTACWWMISGFIVYYSINALFATHLQKVLGLSPCLVATPVALANGIAFLAMGFWGHPADRIGRRWCVFGGRTWFSALNDPPSPTAPTPLVVAAAYSIRRNASVYSAR
jgi:MFS family permease